MLCFFIHTHSPLNIHIKTYIPTQKHTFKHTHPHIFKYTYPHKPKHRHTHVTLHMYTIETFAQKHTMYLVFCASHTHTHTHTHTQIQHITCKIVAQKYTLITSNFLSLHRQAIFYDMLLTTGYKRVLRQRIL